MITITYIPDNAEAVLMPDMHINAWVADAINKQKAFPDQDFEVKTSSEMIVTAFRVAIATGEIEHTMIQFMFFGETIKADANGRINDWPTGFCDYNEIMLGQMLSVRARS